jgi:Zn-dependent protease
MFNFGNFDPLYFTGFLLGFVIGTTLHEFMHAYSALRLGDTLAASEGRVTLNPAAHFDPFGFIMGVLMAMGAGFLAWGRPVPVNPYAIRYGRRGMAIVAVAGPLANLALALALVPLYRFGAGILPADARQVLEYMILVNIWLFAFNLIPIPPLDGYNILIGVLPNAWVSVLEPIRRYALPILLLLVFFVPYIGNSIGLSLSPVLVAMEPVTGLLRALLLGERLII